MNSAKVSPSKFLQEPLHKSSLVIRSNDLTVPKTKYYDVDLESEKIFGGAEEKSILGNPPSKRSRRQRACTLCCCTSLYVTLIVLLALTIVIIKLIPKNPSLSLGNLQLTEFLYNESASTGPEVTTSLTFGLNLTNRNPHAEVIYDDITLGLYYKDDSLGSVLLPGFEQTEKNTTMLIADLPKTVSTIQGQSTVTSLNADEQASQVQLQVMGVVRGKLKVLGMKVKKFDIAVLCLTSVQPGVDGPQITSCYFDA